MGLFGSSDDDDDDSGSGSGTLDLSEESDFGEGTIDDTPAETTGADTEADAGADDSDTADSDADDAAVTTDEGLFEDVKVTDVAGEGVEAEPEDDTETEGEAEATGQESTSESDNQEPVDAEEEETEAEPESESVDPVTPPTDEGGGETGAVVQAGAADRLIPPGQTPIPGEIIDELEEKELLPTATDEQTRGIEALLDLEQTYIDAWDYDEDEEYPVDVSPDLRLSEGTNAFLDLLAAEYTRDSLHEPLKVIDGRLFTFIAPEARAEITEHCEMSLDEAKAIQIAQHYYAREHGLEAAVPHHNVMCIAAPQSVLQEIAERFDVPADRVDLSESAYEAERAGVE